MNKHDVLTKHLTSNTMSMRLEYGPNRTPGHYRGVHTHSHTWGNSKHLSVLATFTVPNSGFLILTTASILQKNTIHSRTKESLEKCKSSVGLYTCWRLCVCVCSTIPFLLELIREDMDISSPFRPQHSRLNILTLITRQQVEQNFNKYFWICS